MACVMMQVSRFRGASDREVGRRWLTTCWRVHVREIFNTVDSLFCNTSAKVIPQWIRSSRVPTGGPCMRKRGRSLVLSKHLCCPGLWQIDIARSGCVL